MKRVLARIFGKRGARSAPSPLPDYALPPHTRAYAIGDIHGRVDLLGPLLSQIEADAAGFDGRCLLVSIGDTIDRGPHSAQCVTLLMNALPTWEKVIIQGNHENAMLAFLDRPKQAANWLAWGGVQALESYGVAPYGAKGLRPPEALAAELHHALDELGHMPFYTAGVLYHTEGQVLFTHAGVRPNVPLERQMADDFLFIRDDFVSRPHHLPYRVVFGHTILPEPLVTPDRIGLDTGAFMSGTLTAVALEGTTARILQAKIDSPAA